MSTKKKDNVDFLKLAEFCTGTGGFSLAFESTNKVKTIYSNDFEKNSKKIFEKNFNRSLECKDIHDIELKDIPKHDILCAGFPCFIAGTRVLTSDGYKSIETIKNEKLITHTGESRDIINLQRKVYSGNLYHLKLKHRPDKIICTPEHPFYIREQSKIWNNSNRNYDTIYSKPEWKPINEIKDNHYFGMVINQREVIPEFVFTNQSSSKNIKIKLDNPHMWFMMGYFVVNGWIEETIKPNNNNCINKILFTINNDDEIIIVRKIRKILPITDNKCPSGKCNKYGCADFIWFNILKMFGKYAHGKIIPEWVHDAPKDLIQAFIDGYQSADGCQNKNTELQITCVSVDLVLNLQRLCLKLGLVASVKKEIRLSITTIGVIDINQRDTYQLQCKMANEISQCGFIKDSYVWFPAQDIHTENVMDVPVYNFEVDIDNSYIVENTIVHNCQPFSLAGKKEGFEDPRSNVFWKLIKIVEYHKPRFVVFENVKNLKSHDEGKTFSRIKDEIEKINYYFKYEVLNTCKYSEIPQNRERIYIVCFRDKNDYNNFDFNFKTNITNKKIVTYLESNVEDNYYYDSRFKNWNEISTQITKHINTDTIYQFRRYYIRENKNKLVPTLTANMGSGGHNVPLIRDDNGIRKLTPRECFRLQGFPDSYVLDNLSNSALYKLAGNAISIPVVILIANKLIEIKNK